jgi:hypothetical protein
MGVERYELVSPQDRGAERLAGVAQDPLVAALLEDLDAGEGGDGLPQKRERHGAELGPAVPGVEGRRPRGFRQHTLGEAELVVQFDGPRLQPQGAGLARRPGLAVDHHHTHAEPGEAGCGHESTGARTHDDHVGLDIHLPSLASTGDVSAPFRLAE